MTTSTKPIRLNQQHCMIYTGFPVPVSIIGRNMLAKKTCKRERSLKILHENQPNISSILTVVVDELKLARLDTVLLRECDRAASAVRRRGCLRTRPGSVFLYVSPNGFARIQLLSLGRFVNFRFLEKKVIVLTAVSSALFANN